MHMGAGSVERATCFTYSASPVDFPIGGTMFTGQSNPTNLYSRQSLVLTPSAARTKKCALLTLAGKKEAKITLDVFSALGC